MPKKSLQPIKIVLIIANWIAVLGVAFLIVGFVQFALNGFSIASLYQGGDYGSTYASYNDLARNYADYVIFGGVTALALVTKYLIEHNGKSN